MILLSPSAIVAAQMDHFATQPTHAKLIHSSKSLVDPNDLELTSVAPDLTQGIKGTYVYGTVNGQTGDFTRMSRTPLVYVILDTGGATYASDTVVLPPFVPNPAKSNEVNAANQQTWQKHYDIMLLRNRAALAAQHIMSAAITPNPTEPWLSQSTPAKKAWHFMDVDFDAVASVQEPKLAGTVI
jgi:hypothetical protein